MSTFSGERDPLVEKGPPSKHPPIWTCIIILLVVGLVSYHNLWPSHQLPDDPVEAARQILKTSPVVDGHIVLGRLASAFTSISQGYEGQVGGFFWSLYFECPNGAEGPDFINATWLVRNTLEQIDVAQPLENIQIDIRSAMKAGKIASLLGVEGAHQIGNSLAVLRQYYTLGVRYMTLTHICHNAFADSGGYIKYMPPLHNGLSEFGHALIREMNRLGMVVDLSHTSDATALQVLELTRAPVIWSHSSARAIFDVARNVPDEVLAHVGEGEGKTDAVIMVNFVPFFLALPGMATVSTVADHLEHIATVVGKRHVGIGSDFDGADKFPVGLEDASTYPNLIAELYSRGWTETELAGLACENLLRVLEGVERVAQDMQAAGVGVAFDLYDKRPDLPVRRSITDVLDSFKKQGKLLGLF